MASDRVLLQVKDLKKHFPITKGLLKTVVGYVKAVDGVNFVIHEGETLGLVGESGCGKTTIGKMILRALEPTHGQITFSPCEKEIDITHLNHRELKDMGIRKDIQMIFQDPYSSLNPRMTIMDIIADPLKVNNVVAGKELEDRVKELMMSVGLNVQHMKRYPHAFSGGQRQRISIARALALGPRLIVADEPVSALDVSVQAQILNLLQDLQEELHLTYLFISHDLSVVEHISDRTAVMYVGHIVELSETERLFSAPKHPYTEALLSAVPKADPRSKYKRITMPGEVADPSNSPSGCIFHPRCLYSEEICKEEVPRLREIEDGHFVRCHYADILSLRGVA